MLNCNTAAKVTENSTSKKALSTQVTQEDRSKDRILINGQNGQHFEWLYL